MIGREAAESIALSDLTERVELRAAFADIDANRETALADLIEICEIEAPPFCEAARGRYLASRFAHLGLKDVHTDTAGNVLATRPGSESGPYVVVSAHLDTVFPPGTDCSVHRDGNRLQGPGVGDNGSGLAALLSLARALDAGQVETRLPILFLATVGEEGEGDLRGVRHFFAATGGESGGWRDNVDAFVSLDGPAVERITNRALGSRRFAVGFDGPGGHSWGDFGIVNPIHALGRAIARLAAYPVPLEPRTSYCVGVISGGKSVNTIADHAEFTVDLRSVDLKELDRLEAWLRAGVAEAVEAENRSAAVTGTQLVATVRSIGSRPAGETPPCSRLVRTVENASLLFGIRTRLECSSTDSNVPIDLGIPAVTIGSGGTSAHAHCLNEWLDITGREVGLKRLVLIAVALAGLADR